MQRFRVSQNPVLLEADVRYIGKTGYVKHPHQAVKIAFKIPGTRKWRTAELHFTKRDRTRAGRITKEVVLRKIEDAILVGYKEIERERLKRERAKRERLKKKRRAVKPTFSVAKVKETETIVRSGEDTDFEGKIVRLIGENHEFDKGVPIYEKNFDKLTEKLREQAIKELLDFVKANGAEGKHVWFKIFGAGVYDRNQFEKKKKEEIAKIKRHFRNAEVRRIKIAEIEEKYKKLQSEDQIGFALPRFELDDKRVLESIKFYVDKTLEKMRNKFFGVDASGRPTGEVGYFNRRVGDSEFYITGFRLEFVQDDSDF